ncbi:MAG: NAD-dependent epimerase/dehydratase family protein [Bacteroidaceae bacterium]|nr:NAD-dependent epimerase/dehydratase family protein [Bacteroidaceae bacterium]
MKILITGVHGFVGSNLVHALSAEHEIYGLDIIAPEKEGVVKTFGWDVLSEELGMKNDELPEVDAIIHLAGKAHDTKNQAQADVYFKVNTDLTKKIYDYFLHSSVRKFIFFSSVKAAADRVEGDFVDETVVPKPKGPYGESKIAAERYILENEKMRVKNGQEVYILRPCMIHGPGNKGNLNLLYNVVSKGSPWPLGAFENRRTFMSIDNLCFVIKGLLTQHVESGIYHVNDDEAVSTNELIEIICEALGKKPHIWHINRGLMEGVARVGDVLHLPLNSERLRKLTENYISSNVKIKKALGITELPVKAKDGLYKTIKSFSK